MKGTVTQGPWARGYLTALTLLLGMASMVVGWWALLAPGSFADAVRFPPHEHFLHDIGAFQIGIAVSLLLALIWSDAVATVLAAFLAGNTIHAVNHAVDLDLGGRASDPWLLAAVSVLVATALVVRLRGHGYVVGAVTEATTPQLAPYVRQKTILLTTFRRDGTSRGVPVSIAVDGDRAYVRSFEKAAKVRRLRRNPTATIATSGGLGKPTGPALRVQLRLLDGAEDRTAARLLRRKHPLLHGVLVPLSHRLGRAKAGRTVHFELVAVPVSDPTPVGNSAGLAGDAE